MSNDTIYRQAAIDALCKVGCGSGYCGIPCVDVEAIELLPSAQPERKIGYWKRHNTYRGDSVSGFIDPDWRCSKCGRQANVNAWCMYDLTDFCPHCGADLRGEKDDQGTSIKGMGTDV